jgi:CNP1-like family protein
VRAALAFLLLAACSTPPQEQSDWERQHVQALGFVEEAPPLPAAPRRETLLEFQVGPRGGARFFVDAETLEPGKDGVVRYVLVVRSTAGADTISFEGLRCATAESRRYAIGRADGSWGGRPGAWAPAQPWQRVLGREYFCPQGAPIRDRAEGVHALREGGHPFARGFSGDRFRDGRQ